MGWSSYAKLLRLRCPTLLMHGLEDRLIPAANARVLAERIPGATLIQFEHASHWLHSDQPVRAAQAVQDFIGHHRQGVIDTVA